jgi:hypothetical protein
MVLAQPIAHVIPSILKLAVSGFAATATSFLVLVSSDHAIGLLAVSLQLNSKVEARPKANSDLEKFIILGFVSCAYF